MNGRFIKACVMAVTALALTACESQRSGEQQRPQGSTGEAATGAGTGTTTAPANQPGTTGGMGGMGMADGGGMGGMDHDHAAMMRDGGMMGGHMMDGGMMDGGMMGGHTMDGGMMRDGGMMGRDAGMMRR